MAIKIYYYIAIICFIILLFIVQSKNTQKKHKKIKEKFTDSTGNNILGYWSSYNMSDTRSKCFDCDRTSKFKHGSNCFDCELKGGRGVNKLFNKVLTR